MTLPENERVSLGVEVPLAGQQVEAEEPVVSPALAHLEVRRELAHDVLGRVTRHLVEHLHAVFVSDTNICFIILLTTHSLKQASHHTKQYC